MDSFLGAQEHWSRPKVLIVCEDGETGGLWAHSLRQKNLEVTLVRTAEDALARWPEEIPDLVLIDVSGAQLDALELIRRLRAESVAPILLFTPRNNEDYLIEAYNAGADEVDSKPVSPALFLVKLRAWLRRVWTIPAEALDTIQSSDLLLDPRQRAVITPKGLVKLTNLEFRVLYLLMSHPGWVLPSEEIIQKVWGYSGSGDSVLLKNVIYRLRRKIEANPEQPSYIQTEAGTGYRFKA